MQPKDEERDEFCCLGKTLGYPRYSGYDTQELEATFLSTLGPMWVFGDPLPPHPITTIRSEKGSDRA